MITPIRCFTCGKTIANIKDFFDMECAKAESESKPSSTVHNLEGMKHFDKHHMGKILDRLGCTRMCCRRHLLTDVDMMDKI